MNRLPCSALPAAPFFFLTFSLSFFLSLLLPLPEAVAVHRCERQGRITYTDQQCADGERETAALPRAAPAPAEREPAAGNPSRLQRENAEVARLQALREQRERQERQIRDLAARGAAARERKCRSLELQLKWREEDLREAPLDKAGKARTRLRRTAEKYGAECR